MSYHDASLPHGADDVARLARASETERRFVAALRLWLTTPEAQAEVWRDFAAAQGPAAGRAALRAFEAYLEAVAHGASRKLWRHNVGCVCLGRDEAALAEAMRAAAAGNRERAYAALAPLVRTEALPRAVEAAGALGLALAAVSVSIAPVEGSAPRPACFRRLH